MFIQQTWDIHESWLHHSEFLEEEELKDSKRYHYRACWGLPTRRKPIPRATASVYFVIVISKFKPDVSIQKCCGWTGPLRDKSTVAFLRQGNARTVERLARSQQLS